MKSRNKPCKGVVQVPVFGARSGLCLLPVVYEIHFYMRGIISAWERDNI